MTDILVLFSFAFAGFFAGRYTGCINKKLLTSSLLALLMVILFVIGLKLGFSKDIEDSFFIYGRSAFIITFFSCLFSVVFTFFAVIIYRKYAKC